MFWWIALQVYADGYRHMLACTSTSVRLSISIPTKLLLSKEFRRKQDHIIHPCFSEKPIKTNWKQLNKDRNKTEYHIPGQAVVNGNLEIPAWDITVANLGLTMESTQGRRCWLALVLAGLSNVEGLDGVAIKQTWGMWRSILRKGNTSAPFSVSWDGMWSQRLPFTGLCGKLGRQLKRQRGYPLKMGQAIFHSFVLDFLLEPVFVILV